MDRMLYVAMSGAKQTMLAQAVNNNNLANVSTHGFRADLFQQRSMHVTGDGLPTRVFAMTERPGFREESGSLETTGRQLDVAIDGQGWIAVDPGDGSEAFTRSGNFHIDEAGWLTTSSGHKVLGDAGAINIPPAEKFEIGKDGTITILPLGQDPSAMAAIGRIKLVDPPRDNLVKGKDGLVRAADGIKTLPDARVKMVSGALESSNVNAMEALVNMISLARQFEAQVKMMDVADQAAQNATQMMRL